MQLPFWPNPLGYRNIDFGLERVHQLLERLDNPHQKLPPTIHIAGTNGKGSTLAFLKAIFESANLKVHCYTSPHLVRFNERIILAGKEIENDFLNKILQECKKASEIEPKINVTFFEGITVAAFLAFSRIKADVLLLETGMGGRLDATNVIEKPLATIITPISFDHTEFLGKTLAEIAFEKAGIIKPEVPVIVSAQKSSALKVLKNVAEKNRSKALVFGEDFSSYDYKINLAGAHQFINASTAITAILAQKKFKISKQNIKQGVQSAVWQARLQKITDGKFYEILNPDLLMPPLQVNHGNLGNAGNKNWIAAPNCARFVMTGFELFLDGSHNPAGAKTISNWLKSENKITKTKNYLICAMLKDKDSQGFLKYLSKQTEMLIGLKIKDEKKSKTAGEISRIARALKIKAKSANDFASAIKKIKKYHHKEYQSQPAKIIICGSLYLAGQFLQENN